MYIADFPHKFFIKDRQTDRLSIHWLNRLETPQKMKYEILQGPKKKFPINKNSKTDWEKIVPNK